MQRHRFVSLFLFGLLAAAPTAAGAQTTSQVTPDQVFD
jgi:hypothetical protein